MGLDSLQDGLNVIKSKPAATAAILGGAVAVGAGVAVGASLLAKKRSKSSKRKIKHTKRGWKADRKRFNKRQKWEVAYRKRKHRKGSKRIHYARKTGQPYIILKSGKPKFIKGKRRLR